MKRKLLVSGLILALSSSLYAGGEFKELEPVIDTPLIEVEEKRNYNVALKLGTLGVGLDVSTAISDNLAVRFNVNGLKYNHVEEIDDIKYDGDFKPFTAGVLLDYFPLDNAFRLSGGAYYNGNKFIGTATPTATTNIEINGISYGVNDVGQLDTEITFDKIAPYIGIGWGNDTRTEGWGLSLDIGAMYHGTPKADLDVTVNNPLLEAQIKNDVVAEKQELLDEIEKYKVYPVVMIGVNYTF